MKRAEDETWKKCRYLGTRLVTEADMKRRKCLANTSLNKIKYRYITNDRKLKLSINIQIQVYNAYMTSDFLHKSETQSNREHRRSTFVTGNISVTSSIHQVQMLLAMKICMYIALTGVWKYGHQT